MCTANGPPAAVDGEDFFALSDVVVRPRRTLVSVFRVGIGSVSLEEVWIGQSGLVDVSEQAVGSESLAREGNFPEQVFDGFRVIELDWVHGPVVRASSTE